MKQVTFPFCIVIVMPRNPCLLSTGRFALAAISSAVRESGCHNPDQVLLSCFVQQLSGDHGIRWLPATVQKRNNHCIAVIGDGAITGGMAYEAMNHAGFMDTNMIVILNDNQQARRHESICMVLGPAGAL